MTNHSIAKIICTWNKLEAYRDCGMDIGIDMYLFSTFQGPLGGRSEKDYMSIVLEEGDVFTFVAYEMLSGAKYDLSTLMLVCEQGKIRISPESLIDKNYSFEVVIEGI